MNTKKILTALTAFILAATMLLSGCGNKDKKEKDDAKTYETIIAEVDSTEDEEEEPEDNDTHISEPNSATYKKPGTKGFTLEELRAALIKFYETGDIHYINQFTLYKSNKVLDNIIENITCYGDTDLSSDLIFEIKLLLSSNFDSIRHLFKDERRVPYDITCELSIEGDIYDIASEIYVNNAEYENKYFEENNGKGLYELVEDAVAETYNGKITYKSLTYASVNYSSYDPNQDSSATYIGSSTYILETDAGFFLLLDIPDAK